MTDLSVMLTEKPVRDRERAVGYVPELDTFRTIAILLVMCAHWLPDDWRIKSRVLTWGNFGVYLFFVLSGFLITRILMRCREDIEREKVTVGFSIRQFYARRFLRIFPLYYFVLFVAVLMNAPGVRAAIGWHAAYLSNAYFMQRGTFGGPAAPFWSLAVEEQFYLLWPLAILMLPRRFIFGFVAATFFLGTIFHAVALLTRSFGWALMTPAVVNFLAAGALVAVCESALPAVARLSREQLLRAFLALGAIAAILAVILVLLPSFGRKTEVAKVVLHTGASVLFAWMIATTASGVTGTLGKALRFSPMVYLGKISYGLYVYHQFVFISLTWLTPRLEPHVGETTAAWLTTSFIARFAVTAAVASLSWFALEKPLNDLKRFFPYSRKPRPLPLEERGVPIPATSGQ